MGMVSTERKSMRMGCAQVRGCGGPRRLITTNPHHYDVCGPCVMGTAHADAVLSNFNLNFLFSPDRDLSPQGLSQDAFNKDPE